MNRLRRKSREVWQIVSPAGSGKSGNGATPKPCTLIEGKWPYHVRSLDSITDLEARKLLCYAEYYYYRSSTPEIIAYVGY